MALLPRLRRYAYALAGSRAAADDLVQDAYERAIRHIDSWLPGSRLDSWMFQIMRNVHLNKVRSDRVRRDHALSVDTDGAMVDGERLTEARITLETVRQFVWRLPEEQRTALTLVCIEGMTYKEASDVLGLPGGTVASRVARARLALAAFVDGDQAALAQQAAPEAGAGLQRRG
jgi:RNA polymerase sigma-70 factor (ECF subfamily)